ncbi:MAG: hypothetical protein P1P87_01600 [Trueperaceae bacterium]|nr:hypothetical protein [Trueperaceae bacterium]
MERTSRNRHPFVTLLAAVVAALTTLILAAPYAGEFAGGGPGHSTDGVAPCVWVDAPSAPPDTAGPNPGAVPAWATEEKLGGP